MFFAIAHALEIVIPFHLSIALNCSCFSCACFQGHVFLHLVAASIKFDFRLLSGAFL